MLKAQLNQHLCGEGAQGLQVLQMLAMAYTTVQYAQLNNIK